MTRQKLAAAFLVAITAVGASISGCELIASIDHDKIPGAGGSGGTGGAGGATSSTSTATSSSTGVSCTGGAASCSSPATCPASTTACVTATCDASCCGTANAPASTACSDSGGSVCDGAGHCVGCSVAGDCPAQTTACKTNTCDNAHACGVMNATSATQCNDNGGKVCDGSGTCVACLMATDCAPQTSLCKLNVCDTSAHTCGTTPAALGTTCNDNGGTVCDGAGQCVSAHCTDGVKDSDETDVDCGGSCGATCKDTGPQQHCMMGTDCLSHVCSGTLCQPPSCTDTFQNGTETDKDCGGSCPKCNDLKHCAQNSDCTNNLCFGSGPGTCVSCTDGVKDGNETAQDCGGLQCDAQGKTCAPGSACGMAADCTGSASCNGALFTAAATCTGSVCAAGTVTDCSATGKVCDPTAGCVQCNALTDCPATGNECVARTCTSHVCGTSNLGQTVAIAAQTSGNCQKAVCNGAGGTTSIDDPTDLPPASGTVCSTSPACTGSPLGASYTVAATGTDCTADGQLPKHVCGDTSTVFAGTCVQCNFNADCDAINDAGLLTCVNHVCQ